MPAATFMGRTEDAPFGLRPVAVAAWEEVTLTALATPFPVIVAEPLCDMVVGTLEEIALGQTSRFAMSSYSPAGDAVGDRGG